ncbi:MAG TPA: hypothetical protein VIW29_21540 [Polyangiaceae bacterium]
MKNSFQKIAFRFAAVTGLLVGGTSVGCSSTTDPVVAPPPTTTGGNGSATAGRTGTGGSAGTGTTTGGSGGATAGSGGGGGGGNGCPPGQQMLPNGAGCGCPAFNPDYCEAVGKCVNFTKNPEHCGACGMACGATNACVTSACTPDLTTVAEVAGCGKLYLLYANTTLYALNTMAGELLSVPATGAPVKIAGGLTGATAFAVDATNAYVVTGMTVSKVALTAGSTPMVLVTDTMPIYDVAVVGTTLYYAVDKATTDVAPANEHFLGFVKSAPTATVTAAPGGTIVGGGMDLGQPKGVAVSGMNVLYASDSAQNVEVQKGLPVAADPKTDPLHYKLGASQGSLIFGHRSVQTDGTYVYWANDSIQRSKFGEATPVQGQVTASLGLTVAYALSPTTAYFGSDMGDLGKGAFMSDMATPLARKLETITSVVVDAASVYVASGCKILKAPL